MISAARFSELADQLEKEAGGLSSARKAARLPVYKEIVAFGDNVVPLLVQRLKQSHHRPVWQFMLGQLTGQQPSLGATTIDGASDRWVAWLEHRHDLVR